MKRGTSSRESELAHNNTDACKKDLGPISKDADRLGVLLLIADMFDMIARGENMYMIIGATKDRTAFSLTVKGDSAPDPIYAESLEVLNRKAAALL